MALYITRNGQQYGPYSLAEAQEHVRAGSLVMNDLAWQEGLPTWVPLNQIPGFAYVPPPAPAAPRATTTPEAFHQSPAQNKSFLQKLGGGGAALAYLAFKLKFLLPVLKTAGSMFIMIWVYSWRFGWEFAAGFVFLILVHELGHVVAAKWVGMPVSAPLFIPFVGAAIFMKENPRDAWTEAIIGYGGPLAGCIGSWICWGIALELDQPWIMAVASLSFLINLFNLIPVPPLDGGRICSAVSPWFWIIGLVLFGVSIFYFHRWNSLFLIVIILIVALPRIKQTLFGESTPEMQSYYATHISNRLIMAMLYLGLIAALLLGYWTASSQLSYLLNPGPVIN